ncbi:MAG TPA: NADH-quinone oxidoreductase subunit H [Chloroflexota bacterium]|nr:NADH-quinone oxidoreductase subunit H [Chloroflexota bacterium]
MPAILALLLCIPVKLRLNPFSIPNAEQEIYAGPTTEYDGRSLAIWELAHGLEWVALTGLAITLGLPVHPTNWIVGVALFVVLSMLLVLILTTLAAATARLKVTQASRVYWKWGMGIAVLALVMAALPGLRG